MKVVAGKIWSLSSIFRLSEGTERRSVSVPDRRRSDPPDRNKVDGAGKRNEPSKPASEEKSVPRSIAPLLRGLVIVLGICGLGVLVIATRRSGSELTGAMRAAENTRTVLEKIGNTSVALNSVESAARNFAISGKQSHLDPFYSATKAVPENVNSLKELLRRDPEPLRRLSAIEPTIANHLRVMKNMVELGSKNVFRAVGQRDLTDAGSVLMDQIRPALDDLEKQQRARLEQQQADATMLISRVVGLGLSGIVLGSVYVAVCGVWAMRAMRGRGRAEEKLSRLLGSMPDAILIVNAEGKIAASNAHAEKLFGYTTQELQGQSMAMLVPERFRKTQRQYYASYFSQRGDRVPATTLELFGLHKDGREFPIDMCTKPLAAENGLVVTSAIRDITERKRTEHEIRHLNEELEQRAAELENANKELEAFSYSVSHDLRSPLQNIDGFSQILVEDYASRLDSEGRDCLQKLRGSCRHMEEIIEALLALSNMMRAELHIEPVDLSAMARAVVADCQQKDQNRIVDWVIAEGLVVEGDSQLLHVVLENLMNNAWKFTAKHPRARVEFGALPQADGVRAYFVRDDGAGFDVAQATNLFTPFKRFHAQEDFSGTGIGLATVQRVIQRHGGKIWADGAVERGATFCFTLGGIAGATK